MLSIFRLVKKPVRHISGVETQEGERGAGSSDKGKGQVANIEPLSPVACALALLPRHGQTVIPKPLQHLMDAGSPIEDMFDTCNVGI